MMNPVWISLSLLFSLLHLQAEASSTLLIGDSHSDGYFGRALDEKLRTLDGNHVRTEASCGSIIHWWYTGHVTPCGYLGIDEDGKITSTLKAKTPLLPMLLEEMKPDVILIELGANYARGYPDETLTRDLNRLKQDLQISKAKCFWIGPPDSRKFRSDLELIIPKIETLVKNTCTFIDSRKFTHYPDTGGDGVHYGTAELKPVAVHWAQSIFKIISEAPPAGTLADPERIL